MKIVSVGGGPAGLYFAILMKRLDASHEVAVIERNRPDDTFGWGVVFSDETLGLFEQADPESHRAILERFSYWEEIDVFVRGERLRSTGHGFCGVSRRAFLNILQQRCEALGVRLSYETEVAELAAFGDADLILAADGANSRVRESLAHHLRPSIEWGRCRFCWLGADFRLPAFTFIFKENDHGLFQVHAYPFDRDRSTFIVECREEVWKRAALDRADEAATIEYVQELFGEELGGGRLLSNRSIWRAFPTIRNERWHHGNVVLMGDAAHTAHFSIGSGTKLAMEDAIALAEAFRVHGSADVARVLQAYQEARGPEVARLQAAARVSREWFENSSRYLRLPPLPFVFSLLTRSMRITHDNLKRRDPELVERVARYFADSNPHRAACVPVPPAGAAGEPERVERTALPPLFQPFRLRDLTLANRLVVSPMCQYACEDGTPTDWHLVHLGSRAIGGAGLVFAEATHVSPEGRISPGCAGIYKPEHVAAWKRVVDYVHRYTPARIGLQLAHAGRKGSCTRPWQGNRPLETGAWPLLAPSALPFAPGWPTPRAMERDDMAHVRAEFVRAAQMAAEAGFDMLELHMAHGYLLATFISPLTNRRSDEYGGCVENRMRLPLEVFDAVRAVWPAAKPISVRISATDWAPGGLGSDDRVALARLLKVHGCDIVDVSGGGTVPGQQPVYGRMFQVQFSDEIRLEAGIPTMTVGNIASWADVNSIIAAGRADLCVLARAHLYDPYWTRHAAYEQGYELPWPDQYVSVKGFTPRLR